MDPQKAIELRALADVITERLRQHDDTRIGALCDVLRDRMALVSPVTVEPAQVTVQSDLAPVAAALRLLAEAQAESNRVLAELVKALGQQKPVEVTVAMPPRRPLRLKRDDGTEAIIQEL
jgi:hypothetical protein